MKQTKPIHKWGLLWRQRNRLDGDQNHIMAAGGIPYIFQTRAQARAYIKENYSYIKWRMDLLKEPHGWKQPTAVKIEIRLAPTSRTVK